MLPSLDFRNTISEEVLHAYLSRSVSACNELTSTCQEDDLRMYARLGVLFLGRAIYPFEWVKWQGQYDGNEKGMLEKAGDFVNRVHRVNPRIIVQGICAEATFPTVGLISVPPWVFDEFGEPVEHRTFCLDAMLNPARPASYTWTGLGLDCTVLDITRPETQRWMYYRCRTLIDAGCEAIHMGQPHMYAEHDHGAVILESLFERVRSYARRAARRGLVLLDAHTHGIARNGHLLFDSHARPLSAVCWRDKPYRIILQLKGSSMGGISPSGWSCRSLPYLVEIDNWGGYSIDPANWHDMDKRASRRWGWDDIAWFAHQPPSERDHFLQYAHRWLRLQDPSGHFQMPARRTLHHAGPTGPDGAPLPDYHANMPSSSCPFGFGQENAIERIWSEPEPAWLANWDARFSDEPTPITPGGRNVPEPAVIVGMLQRMLGGEPGDSMSPYSRLCHRGGGRFELAALIPWRGEYEFRLALGGTMTETVTSAGFHSAEPFILHVHNDNTRVRLHFSYTDRHFTALDDDGKDLCIAPD